MKLIKCLKLFTIIIILQILFLHFFIFYKTSISNRLIGIDNMFNNTISYYYLNLNIKQKEIFKIKDLLEDKKSILRLRIINNTKIYDDRESNDIINERIILNNNNNYKDIYKNFSWSIYRKNDNLFLLSIDHTIISGANLVKIVDYLYGYESVKLPNINFYPLLTSYSIYNYLYKYIVLKKCNIKFEKNSRLRIINYKMKYQKSKYGVTTDLNILFFNLLIDCYNKPLNYLNFANLFAFENNYNLLNKQGAIFISINKNDDKNRILKKIKKSKNDLLAASLLPHILSNYDFFKKKWDVCLSSVRMKNGSTQGLVFPSCRWGIYIFNSVFNDRLEGSIHINNNNINIDKIIYKMKSYGMNTEIVEILNRKDITYLFK